MHSDGERPAVATVCAYCGVGCGMLVRRLEDGATVVSGDALHPANYGQLCLKGASLADTLGLDGRVLAPEVHGEVTGWEEATAFVASQLNAAIASHGPESVAFYVSGQMLTEDYYVANKLMKGFIGSANIDTNSRLCMASPTLAQQLAFGADAVPGCYEDLEFADLVVLVGSNLAECHPMLYRRLEERRRQTSRPKLVVIDPRRTATAAAADLHLQLAPATDGALFCGLLTYLADHGALAEAYLAAHVQGAAATLQAARPFTLERTAEACGLPQALLSEFFQWFQATPKVMSLYSQGINQSTSGTDKILAIINCHLATGRIGRPGTGPFALTGQGNAMGGREVGGLATQLAAHMRLDNPEHRRLVAEFWRAPRLAERAGLKAMDLFRAVHAGQIKVLWIMATNPLVSLPDAGFIGEALDRCPCVVVSECFRSSATLSKAHVLLPAVTWGEKDGTVTNSERRISRQRGFLPWPELARPDWWIISAVAKKMGFSDAFAYTGAAAIFREHARLSGLGNDGSRPFDLSGLADLDDQAYAGLTPQQWPINSQTPQGRSRLFGDGRFATADGRAVMRAVTPQPPAHAVCRQYPLALTTGRFRDQWHTMTRTSRSPRLGLRDDEPTVAVHPEDALALGLAAEASGLVVVESRWGQVVTRVQVASGQRRGSLFMPFHWNEALAVNGKANTVVNPEADPRSGQPDLKHTPVRVRPLKALLHGFLISREPLTIGAAAAVAYAVQIPRQGFTRHEVAFTAPGIEPEAWLGQLFGDLPAQQQQIHYRDQRGGSLRLARFGEGRLVACAFLASTQPLPARSWVESLFHKPAFSAGERLALLSGC